MPEPELSVVVASHDRALRLRWLLNALQEQTLDPALWEVVVCHDSRGPETEQLLAGHPLTGTGTLRWTRLAAGTGLPGANRNAAIRLARAPTLVFTDDDCRPPEGWLESVRDAVARNPGAVVQGPVQADPDESAMLRSAYPRSQSFSVVPRPWAECANIVYPRELVDAVGGFAEDVRTGEDTDLNLRARAAGGRYVGEERMLTFHAVEEGTLLDWVLGARRWGDLALLVQRHPELREDLFLRVFWKPSHAWLIAALGVGSVRRSRGLWPAIVVAWGLQRQWRGGGLRGRIRHLLELPGWAIIDAAEIAVLARASLRHRTLML